MLNISRSNVFGKIFLIVILKAGPLEKIQTKFLKFYPNVMRLPQRHLWFALSRGWSIVSQTEQGNFSFSLILSSPMHTYLYTVV